jgi:hypothetical protein
MNMLGAPKYIVNNDSGRCFFIREQVIQLLIRDNPYPVTLEVMP